MHRYEQVSHLAVDSLERRAAEDELGWLIDGTGGALRPRLTWRQPADGRTAVGEIVEVNTRLGAFYRDGVIGIISERTRESQPLDLARIRGSVRHEFAHALEDRLGWSAEITATAPPPLGLHERQGVCTHLARRWSKRRPSREAVFLLSHPARLAATLDQWEAELAAIGARQSQAPAEKRERGPDALGRPFHHKMLH
jgi:hypothetical protein